MTRRERFQFFLEHAGYATPPGRAACALELAQAEQWAERMQDEGRLAIRWEVDEEPYEQGIYTEEEVARRFETGAWTGPFGCIVRIFAEPSEHVDTLAYLDRVADHEASLWGIVVGPEETNDPYCRVVAAELAMEVRSDYERETEERARAARQDIATVAS